MAFEAEIARAAARMAKYNAVQAGIQAQRYTSAVPYFAFARAAQMVQDLAKTSLQAADIGVIRDNIPKLLTHDFGLMTDLKGKEGAAAVYLVKKTIQQSYKGLYNNWISGIYRGVGNVYAAVMEQFMGTGDLLWAYKHLAHRIAVTPKMARHWMKTFRPTVPNIALAWNMWKRGLVTEPFFNKIAAWEGWSDNDIKLLKSAFLTWPTIHAAFRMYARGQIDFKTFKRYAKAEGWPDDLSEKIAHIYEWWPSAYEAFFMWKKGIIDKATRNKFYKGQGYTSDMYEKITANFEYVPTLYDLIRIADYQEVDLIWATRVMQERGLKSRDISKFINYLKYRPLREEVRNLTNQLLYRYQHGRITPTDFDTELAKLPIGETEKSLLSDYGAMLYEDELITEQMDILKWRFRMGYITEDDYLAGLINLGIREEKANLIVEAEKARGYFGYY